MTVKILVGDAHKMLLTLPDESVHCVVTSPPYWGLRDYGIDGQLGMERSLGEYLDVMVEVFREIRRVLRKDGTLWLNLGDSYAANINGRSALATKELGKDDRTFRDKPFSTIGPIYVDGGVKARSGQSYNQGNVGAETGGRINPGGIVKPKDLCGIPWRVAFALQEDGWYLRQDIIWSKPNPMPESVRDRCTKAHEYIFLMSKSERYYFDQDAIKEDAVGPAGGNIVPTKGAGQDLMRTRNGIHLAQARARENGGFETRNKRSVWDIATQPFSEAHFATFPPALIEPCILAGCPEGGTVLDPFIGAGTTGLVADRLRRNCIGIDLNPDYAVMAERRIRDDAGMFYNAENDFSRSLDDAYAAIRERVKAGGPGWEPK